MALTSTAQVDDNDKTTTGSNCCPEPRLIPGEIHHLMGLRVEVQVANPDLAVVRGLVADRKPALGDSEDALGSGHVCHPPRT